MVSDPIGWQKSLLDTFWRVFLVGALGMAIGGIVGVACPSSYSPRSDGLLLGAFSGASIGLIIGWVWHLWRAKRGSESTHPGTCGVIVLSFIVVPLMTGFLWFHIEDTRDRICQLQELSPDQIQEIRVCDRYDLDEVLMVIDDRESIEEFVACCEDLRMYAPNHPTVDESWQVVLVGEPTIRLDCYFLVGVSDEVYGGFHDQQVRGSFAGRSLRGWFERRLP